MVRIESEPGFVLHSYPYRDTSLIVDVLTHHYGRVSLMARSARGYKSRFQGKLQLFSPLLLSYAGRSELKNLRAVEFAARPFDLQAKNLMCGFYLNELLIRLSAKDDPHPRLFDLYADTLQRLQSNQNVESCLRLFEKKLLAELGYALPLQLEAETQQDIQPQLCYLYFPQRGFIEAQINASSASIFKGESLLALADDNIQTEQHRADAKRLMRQVLAQYLGDKPLKSRELLR
jgi:DNA repair protein RecO (recombination protein O)